MTNEIPLLTIAIPTYNRAANLDLCLKQLCKQLNNVDLCIELIVSNNCSTDNTENIVNSYLDQGYPIKYILNSENIGGEKNVVQCFTMASGKYVLILGDDDILLDGKLKTIVEILQYDNYGVVYINSYGFKDDYLTEKPKGTPKGIIIYDDNTKFINRVNFWVTFLSGNIVNKSLVDDEINTSEFLGTNLPHLNWILSAILKAKKNIFVEEHMVAFKKANTGGYKLCQVFGVNINRIFNAFIERGFDTKNFKTINNKLLLSFFPNLILTIRKDNSKFAFGEEDYYGTLKTVFASYTLFWLIVVPSIKWPIIIAYPWFRVLNKLLNS